MTACNTPVLSILSPSAAVPSTAALPPAAADVLERELVPAPQEQVGFVVDFSDFEAGAAPVDRVLTNSSIAR